MAKDVFEQIKEGLEEAIQYVSFPVAIQLPSAADEDRKDKLRRINKRLRGE